MFKLIFVLLTLVSFNLFSEEDVGTTVDEYYAAISKGFVAPKDMDLSAINRCVDVINCDPVKVNQALDYIASLAIGRDYVNNLYDKIKEVSTNLITKAGYTSLKDDADKAKAKNLNGLLTEHLKIIAKKQFIKQATEELKLLKGADYAATKSKIDAVQGQINSDNGAAAQAFTAAYSSETSQSVKDLVDAGIKDVASVTPTKDKSGTDLYNKIKSQILEACKKGKTKNDAICKTISNEQALAYISGNDPSANVVTKYSDKNCPLLTRLFQKEHVGPIMNAICADKTNKAYSNQMNYGLAGFSNTIKQVNFVQLACPEMAANDSFIQNYTLAMTGSGLSGVPSSLDVAAGTGATVPGQNMLAYNPTPGTSWNKSMWNPSSNGVNTNNAVVDPFAGGSTVKMSPSTTTDFYASIANGYSGWAPQAKSFSATNQSEVISDFSNKVQENISLYSQNKTTHQVYKNASADLSNIAGGGRSNMSNEPGQDDVIYVRGEISKIQVQKRELMAAYMGYLKTGYLFSPALREMMNRFGSFKDQIDVATVGQNASNTMIAITGLNMEQVGLESQLVYNSNYYNMGSLDIMNMYAQADGKLNLRKNNIKTPLTLGEDAKYTLKPNWRENLKNLSKEMLVKAEEAKRNANIYKANLQKLLDQKIPALSLKNLPSLDILKYEIKNMESWKKAGIKNMQIIDKAVSSYKAKRFASADAESKKTEQQAVALRNSMSNMVNSIASATGPANKAYAELNNLYTDVPRVEQLRVVAKQMVEEGL